MRHEVETWLSLSLQSTLTVVPRCLVLPVQGVSALRFGPDARSLLVGSSDHNLRVFAAPAAAADAE